MRINNSNNLTHTHVLLYNNRIKQRHRAEYMRL
nr:MAG TPA: hypothetical protein [Bacteriophage sp.]DAI33126.1 MAG TPA: hypothetical protein [Caudoviricetes sp.]